MTPKHKRMEHRTNTGRTNFFFSLPFTFEPWYTILNPSLLFLFRLWPSKWEHTLVCVNDIQ